MYDYPGVIHVHSNYSDGSASYCGIASAAAKAGVKFVLINDHDTLGGLSNNEEGYKSGVLMLIGAEISPKNNHFICYNVKNLPSNRLEPKYYIKNVYEQGGFGFLAHPDHKPNLFLKSGGMGWDSWDAIHPFGIEIWNYFTQWSNRTSSFKKFIRSVITPSWCLQEPCNKLMDRWDQIAQNRCVPAIAGVDAHGGRQFGWVPSVLSSYKKQFQTLRTHALIKNPLIGEVESDRKQIIDAIRRGRSYLVNYHAGSVENFNFSAGCQDKQWYIGDELSWEKGLVFIFQLPKNSYARLIRNGRKILELKGVEVNEYLVDKPGVYRLEVLKIRGKRLIPWIYTNHIYIRSS
jgi:hypothetical protein